MSRAKRGESNLPASKGDCFAACDGSQMTSLQQSKGFSHGVVAWLGSHMVAWSDSHMVA